MRLCTVLDRQQDGSVSLSENDIQFRIFYNFKNFIYEIV